MTAQELGNDFAAFDGAVVVVLGGMGFIGSALARRLVELGSEVVVVDSQLPGSGANPFNLNGYERRLRVVHGDIRDAAELRPHLRTCAFLFNLAAQVSHQASIEEPLIDLDINGRAPLAILEICRAENPGVVIVYGSTRQIYGRPERLPVDESHPIRPVDVNGIDKHAGEEFHRLYHDLHGMRCCSLRLTNTYGPRMRIADARQTFVGIWLRSIIEQRPFELWGGDQLRDFTYVDDAVEAFLRAAVSETTAGTAFNVGGDDTVSLRRLAELLVAANGGGQFAIREFPAARKRIDIGDYYSDDRAFRKATGWKPLTALADGLHQSLVYFREHFSHYI